MRNVFAIMSFCVVFGWFGCSKSDDERLLGTWETDLIWSEWGSNKITVTYLRDGRLLGTNHFSEGSETNSNLAWSGRYTLGKGIITHIIDGRSQEIYYEISDDKMNQRMGDEKYYFRRK